MLDISGSQHANAGLICIINFFLLLVFLVLITIKL